MMDAAMFMSEVRTNQPTQVEAIEKLYGLGFWLHSQERYADAALAFRTMLRTEPTDERGWLALGSCHEKIDQPRIAVQLYAWGASASRSAVRCHLARARLLMQLGYASEAAEVADLALQIAEEQGEEELICLAQAEGNKHVAQH